MSSMLNFFIGRGVVLGLIIRTLLGVGQIHFFGGWVCLELNILLFIAVINLGEGRGAGARIKYFIIQGVGSSALLWTLGLRAIGGSGLAREGLIALALSLKLGVAPFQGWFIRVLSMLSWELILLASTLQKILPVFLLRRLEHEVLGWLIGLRAGVRVLGSINQVYLKKILGYSSVFITAWLLACEGEFSARIEYLGVYRVALVALVLAQVSSFVLELNETLRGLGLAMGAVFIGRLLRIGGAPPLIGFYAKVSVVTVIVRSGHLIWRVGLVLSSVFLLYLYMRIFYFIFGLLARQGLSTRPHQAFGRALGLLRVLVVLPWVLCLGVMHGKFWTFRPK